MIIRQTLTILALATILGLGLNLFTPNRIAYIGQYRTLSNSNDPIVPPNAAPGDPPFIAVDVAELEFNSGSAVFVDTREPEDFECGTILGSINIPFDNLPDEDLEKYLDSALGGMAKDHSIITYCSGEECDLSLHLARNLQALGYTRVSIFFGGSREWEKLGLPIERKHACDE
jgi:rhodanese-related sulfurtransferase